jgi:hypothetical protein
MKVELVKRAFIRGWCRAKPVLRVIGDNDDYSYWIEPYSAPNTILDATQMNDMFERIVKAVEYYESHRQTS